MFRRFSKKSKTFQLEESDNGGSLRNSSSRSKTSRNDSVLSENFTFDPDSEIADPGWTEPTKDIIDTSKYERLALQKGYSFRILFCLYKEFSLNPEIFLLRFFQMELVICTISSVFSVISVFYGLTYFTISIKYDRDRELIALLAGICGVIFFAFKFYITIVSLKAIRERIFISAIGCAAGLSILGHIVSAVVSLFLIFALFTQGLANFVESQGTSRNIEFDFGILLMILTIPLIIFVFVLLSQWMVSREIGKALDEYMLEYINAEKERKKKERRERRRKATIEHRKLQKAKQLMLKRQMEEKYANIDGTGSVGDTNQSSEQLTEI